MRTTLLPALLVALSGLTGAAHAAPQEQTAPEAPKCTCDPCQCPGKEAPEAEPTTEPTASPTDSPELIRVRAALGEVSAAMAEDAAPETPAAPLAPAQEPKPAAEAAPARADEETLRAEQVLRALETDLADVEALLEASGAQQAILEDITGETVEVRLVDVSDEGAVTLPSGSPAPQEQRGYLGVMIGEDEEGVAIADVVPASPAAAAGLEAGDILINVGGQSVLDVEELRTILSAYGPGQDVAVTVMRGKHPVRAQVTLGDRDVLGAASVPQVEAPAAQLPDVPAEAPVLTWATEVPAPVASAEVEADEPVQWRVRLVRPEPTSPEVRLPQAAGEDIEIEMDVEVEVTTESDEESCGEDGDCCGECDDDCSEEGECCGECGDDDECCGEDGDCCGECDDDCSEEGDCCGECDEHEHGDEIDMIVDEILHRLREEGALDPLPEGYEEIVTRRERRPFRRDADEEIAELEERIEELEDEIAELIDTLEAVRRELDRRSMR